MPEVDPPFELISSGGGSEAQSGTLYCISSNYGIIAVDIASETYVLTGVNTPTTAFGYGRDNWWYGNGGPQGVEARTLYRIQPELVPNPPQQPRQVIEMIGVGARRLEDIAATPDGQTLYGVGGGFLYSIDRTTGVQADVLSLGFQATGLAYADSGELLASDGPRIYEIDVDNGTTTLLGQLSNPANNDLAGMPLPPVAAEPALPSVRSLASLPNPFHPRSAVGFRVDQAQSLQIAVYDIAGRFVRDLVQGFQGVGEHQVQWDGRDAAGQPVAAGTYVIQLVGSQGLRDTRKIALVR